MKLKEGYIKKITILVLCFVLALAITLQVRTMASAGSTVTANFASDELKNKLLEWQEKYERMTVKLEESSKELESERKSSTSNDESANEKTESLKKYNMLLGLTNVSGEGIVITCKDGQTTNNLATDNISQYLVHDADLREIVNELANAGAEAISINDQRIVSSTSITCAGNIISINGEKVSSPFVIKAIGNQEGLYGALSRPGGYLSLMKEDLSVDIKKLSSVSIKKYNGALTQKYIKNKESN